MVVHLGRARTRVEVAAEQDRTGQSVGLRLQLGQLLRSQAFYGRVLRTLPSTCGGVHVQQVDSAGTRHGDGGVQDPLRSEALPPVTCLEGLPGRAGEGEAREDQESVRQTPAMPRLVAGDEGVRLAQLLDQARPMGAAEDLLQAQQVCVTALQRRRQPAEALVDVGHLDQNLPEERDPQQTGIQADDSQPHVRRPQPRR